MKIQKMKNFVFVFCVFVDDIWLINILLFKCIYFDFGNRNICRFFSQIFDIVVLIIKNVCVVRDMFFFFRVNFDIFLYFILIMYNEDMNIKLCDGI